MKIQKTFNISTKISMLENYSYQIVKILNIVENFYSSEVLYTTFDIYVNLFWLFKFIKVENSKMFSSYFWYFVALESFDNIIKGSTQCIQWYMWEYIVGITFQYLKKSKKPNVHQ